MKKYNNLHLFLTLLLGACYTPAEAAYEDVGVGARVVGLGNAYTAVADDAYSVYYNPAGLGTMDRPHLATTYSRLFTGLSDGSNLQNSFMAFSSPIRDGRHGGYGLAWNYFSLDSLYREMTLTGAYGRQFFARDLPNGLFGGLSVKYLSRSLSNTAAGDQPIGPTGAVVVGQSDPVLKSASKGNLDLDLGLLYRVAPRFTVGLAVQHLTEPNISFASNDTDKLGRNVRLGGAYRTPFTVFSGDLDFHKAPDGTMDKAATLAFEKWLPTLLHGTFGVRTSLGVGSRDLRRLTAGLSYRIYRMQFDYGFAMPFGTVSDTFGDHRMGMSFRFGRPKAAEPKLSEAILENMRELAQAGTPEFRYQAEELALYKRTALIEFLRQASMDAMGGRFADARDKLAQAQALNPADKKVSDSLERVGIVAQAYPEVTGFQTDAALAALYGGALDFIAGRDREALRKVAYAQSLTPGDARFETLMSAMEGKSGVKRAGAGEAPAAAPTLGLEKVVGANLALMEVALKEGDYPKVLKLAAEVLDLDPTHVLAYKRQAAAHYALKQYPEAMRALRSAYKLEQDPEERKTLKSYLDALESLIERQREAARPSSPARPETPAAEPAAAAKARMSPVEIERLYEAGVDLYAQGRLREAGELFKRMLEADPKNVSARRALERVQSELLQGERP